VQLVEASWQQQQQQQQHTVQQHTVQQQQQQQERRAEQSWQQRQQQPPGLPWQQKLLQNLEGQSPFPFLQLPHAIMTTVASKLHREDAWQFAEVLESASPAAAAAVRSSIADWKLFGGMKRVSRHLDVPACVAQLAGLQQLTAQVHIRGTEQHRTGEPHHQAYVIFFLICLMLAAMLGAAWYVACV
jgi:hypothetical protein